MTTIDLEKLSNEIARLETETGGHVFQDDCIFSAARAYLQTMRQPGAEERRQALKHFRLAMRRHRHANNLYISSKDEAVIEAALQSYIPKGEE